MHLRVCANKSLSYESLYSQSLRWYVLCARARVRAHCAAEPRRREREKVCSVAPGWANKQVFQSAACLQQDPEVIAENEMLYLYILLLGAFCRLAPPPNIP